MRCAKWSLFLSLLVGALGCSKPNVPITLVDDNDPEMKAAIEKARGSLDTFIAALNAPKAGQTSFAVKVRFTDGAAAEQMWISPVRFDGKRFFGKLNNEPETVKKFKLGSTVSVEREDITDWMYVENGKLVGGHTTRLLRAKLDPAKRAEFDRNTGFSFD